MKSVQYWISLCVLVLTVGLVSCSDDEQSSAGDCGCVQELNNQLWCNGQTIVIHSVLRQDDAGIVRFYLSPTEGIQTLDAMRQANDYLTVSLPIECLDTKVSFNRVGIAASYQDINLSVGMLGTLQVSLDEQSLQLNLSSQVLSCQYNGSWTTPAIVNRYRVTQLQGDTLNQIVTVFRTPAVGDKKLVTFALGSVKAAIPNELSTGQYTVMFTVPQAHCDGKYHAYKPQEGYHCWLLNNAASRYEEQVTEGRFKVTNVDKGNMCIMFEFSLSDGSSVVGEYQGNPTDVNRIDILPAKNSYTYKNNMGMIEEHKIVEVITKEANGAFMLGFKWDKSQSFSSPYPPLTQLIIKDKSLIGKVDVRLEETPGWEVRCGSLQTEYVGKDDPNAQYKTCSRGTLSVLKIGERYRVALSLETVPAEGSYQQKSETLDLSYEGLVVAAE